MPKGRLTNNKLQDMIFTVGLDVGYGVVKAVTIGDVVTFPSVWGTARELKWSEAEIAAKYPGDQITDDSGSWYVGDLALSQLPTGRQRKLRGRTADETHLGNVARIRLAKVALGKLLPGLKNGDVVHIKIATGLPVDHMRDSADLKASLIGTHRIKTDQTDFVANITDVMVMPQPYGTIYRNMLTDKGELNPCHEADRTGVVDIGTYTIDVALDDEGEYIDAASGTEEAGVYIIQDAVAEAYERDFRKKPSYRQVETIIKTGCAKVSGRVEDYSAEVNGGVSQLLDATLNLMSNKWGNGSDVDVIYLAGGGAEFQTIHHDIIAAYPQAQLVELAQLSNAQGYLNYAHFKARGE